MPSKTKNVNVKMDEKLVEFIDDYVEEKGYKNRSEFIRDAVRRRLDPPLNEETLNEFIEGIKQIEEGKKYTQEEVKERFGIK
ncbi:MAG: ribbon-helix-helix domain-containing protein [Candidatus Saliniplasma sp.]